MMPFWFAMMPFGFVCLGWLGGRAGGSFDLFAWAGWARGWVLALLGLVGWAGERPKNKGGEGGVAGGRKFFGVFF